jgi:hypothetical protein
MVKIQIERNTSDISGIRYSKGRKPFGLARNQRCANPPCVQMRYLRLFSDAKLK